MSGLTARVDQMMEDGLVEEVKRLESSRVATGKWSRCRGLAIKKLWTIWIGRSVCEEAVYILKRDTRHFAKRQLTWFRTGTRRDLDE